MQLEQRPVTAIADLLGVEHVEARRTVTGAEQVVPRTDLQGQVLPARLPATAAAFVTGQASVRHVEVIARLMGGAAAARLSPETWQSLEEQLAGQVGNYTTPRRARPHEGNELRLTRDPAGGGWVKGRFPDAAMYDQIAGLIDAKSTPLTADDQRPLEQRQAEAMAEIFGWVATVDRPRAETTTKSGHTDTGCRPAAATGVN